MSDFKREARYYVIKIKDLSEDQDIALCDLLSGARIPCTDCVVVESDWPNYEHTWATIQRVSDGTYDDPYAENERLRARVAELEAKHLNLSGDAPRNDHRLRKALMEVTATLAWVAHGECRSIHGGQIMTSSQAQEMACSLLAELDNMEDVS